MSMDLDNPPEEARAYVELYERTAKERDGYRRENDTLRRELSHLRRLYDEVKHQRDCYVRASVRTSSEEF